MMGAWKQRRRCVEVAARLCTAVSQRARDRAFYREYGVADSIDGRFDLLVLHAWVVLEYLQETGERVLAQSLVDALFAGFDSALREEGAGDIGMSRRMITMASAFYGRTRVYSAAADDAALAAAILRNVYRGDPSRIDCAMLLSKYVGEARRQMARSNVASGELRFVPVPVP